MTKSNGQGFGSAKKNVSLSVRTLSERTMYDWIEQRNVIVNSIAQYRTPEL